MIILITPHSIDDEKGVSAAITRFYYKFSVNTMPAFYINETAVFCITKKRLSINKKELKLLQLQTPGSFPAPRPPCSEPPPVNPRPPHKPCRQVSA